MQTASASPARSTELRFGLRTALIVLTAACVFLAPTHWFGGFYLGSIAFSVGLVFTCSLVYRASAPGAIATAFVGALLGLVLAVVIIVFFFHAVCNAIACLFLVPFKPRPRTFAASLAVVMIAIYSLSFWQGFSQLEELRTLRMKYPFVSLSDRLTFERQSTVDAPDASQPIQLVSQVAANLYSQEQFFQSRSLSYSRAGALEQLHENYQAEFARAAGFGNMRMDSIYYRVVDFQPSLPLSLPASVTISKVPTSNSELYDVHRAAVDNFIAPDRLGYVKGRDAVAGFEPHQLTSFDQGSCSCGPQRYWQIVRLELVGLLGSNEPRVYTAKSLPPMDQLAGTPHRPLNDFENAALPKLNSQEDAVVDQKPDRIQMLGALRTGKTCLECHEGTRGKLLGAFSYELTPISNPDDNSSVVAQPVPANDLTDEQLSATK